MTITEKYETALRQIAFKALKRKMVASPMDIPTYIDMHNLDADEIWKLVEIIGEIALDALADEAKAA